MEDSGSDMEADVESSDDDMNNSSSDDMDLDDTTEQTKKSGSATAFSEAMTNILGSTLTGSDRKQPILARSKGTERKLEDEKLEYKTRKMLAAEKKKRKDQGRVIPDYTSFEYEKRLRKVSTRGVVKLFNAIRTQQRVTQEAVEQATATRGTQIAKEKAKNVSTMSKSSFLDLLKTGNTTT
ncbi:Rrp15p-domain-containing protein [Halteromyces radiatus]|uniref:Rrp15p-domain-containing protein n=1 Tax=Halteromyces radiatus TaxID=101107 RepID=UPI00222005B7|nr:Rrp15p-domain-containing protein [Halteromyces radiatus]KAI8086094.1 Rrp15p-domain-containing protein [Halteromyces radiatus]